MMRKYFDRPEPEYRLMAIAAARLRSEGLSQLLIAKRLRRSQPEVSRMLDFAEKHRFLASAPSFLSQNIGPAELKEVERRFFVHLELRQALSKLAPARLHLNVQVLPDGDDEFAMAAAGCVARLLQRAKFVGVMWGRTIQRLVSRIGEHRELFDQAGRREALCIPLCGDPVRLMNLGLAKYSASHLAAQLAQAINPDPERQSNQPCLVGVPAYLPRRLFLRQGSGAAANWEAFVAEIPGYREIFGPNGEQPWVERLDMILSGAGIIAQQTRPGARRVAGEPTAAHEETGDFILERVKQEAQEKEGLSEATLARLVYGDIGGWLIEKHDLRAAERRLVESLNQGWTGVKGVHFARVARNAEPDGAPGIILVAAGASKAEMVVELVKRGFVNEILIDSNLSSRLKKLLGLDQ